MGRRVGASARLACVLALVCALVPGLVGCDGLVEAIEQVGVASQEFSDVPARPSVPLVCGLLQQTCRTCIALGSHAYKQALRTYAQGRMVELSFGQRDAVLFSAWQAHDDFGGEASDEGLLTQWKQDYFVTHDWSYYGQRILMMIPGDNVEINEHLMYVEGVFEYPQDSFSDEIRTLTGSDAVIIQTCVPNSDYVRIVYGAWTDS